MGRYEEFLIKYSDLIIDDTQNLPGDFKGFYDNGVILIDKSLPQTKKLEVLAEEIAHHQLTYGNILDQDLFLNRRFEIYARRRSYEMLVPINELKVLFRMGIKTRYEIASHFEISIAYLEKVLNFYNSKMKDATFLFNV